MRRRAVLWRVAVVVGWVGALVGLVALDPDEASWYIAAGAPLTVLVGAVVNRWWLTVVPYAMALALIAIGLVAGSTCAGCEQEDDVALWITVALAVFPVPAARAFAVGLVFGRRSRHPWSAGQHA